MTGIRLGILGLAITIGLWLIQHFVLTQPVVIVPPSPSTPAEPTKPEPERKRSPRPLREAGGAPVLGGKSSPDNAEVITCDLPEWEKKKNIGGRDGAGLCVFTSVEYAARYQGERSLFDLQKNMRAESGGGWPGKLETMVKKYGAPDVQLVQYEGPDPGSIISAAIKSGRMPCITYNGHDPHYSGSIAHMVTCPHYSEQWAVVGDNNFPSDNHYVWMSPAELAKRCKGNGGGWVAVLVSTGPPPPVPRN